MIDPDQPQERIKTLESGNIYFFYRPTPPRTGELPPEPNRLYMVLKPEARELYRLTIISTGKQPDPEAGQRFWGFVDMVRNSPKSLREELAADSYKAKIKGEGYRATALPLGEGVYRIVRHGDHTHLAYALDTDVKEEEVPEAIVIESEASFILSIKNPESRKQRSDPPEKQSMYFPRYLQDKFQGRRFAEADPAAFLDREGAEFQLNGASEELTKELGIKLNLELELADSAGIFRDLRVDRSEHVARPLFDWKWEG